MAELVVQPRNRGRDPRPQDGDIELAINDRAIKANWLAKLTHPRAMKRDYQGQMEPGNICQAYCERVYQYRFELIAQFEMRRTNLWTREVHEYYHGRPNRDTGEVWHMGPRMAKLRQSPSKAHFGPIEQDVWYGGGMRQTDTQLDLVWDELEGTTNLRRDSYKRYQFGREDKRQYVLLESDDFDDARAADLVSPQTELVGDVEVVKRHRLHKLDWRALGIDEAEAQDTTKETDFRSYTVEHERDAERKRLVEVRVPRIGR